MLASTRTNFMGPYGSAFEKKNRSLMDRFRGGSNEPTHRERSISSHSDMVNARDGSGMDPRHLKLDSSRNDRNEYNSSQPTGTALDQNNFSQSQELILPDTAPLTQYSSAKNTVESATNEQQLR